MLALSGDICPLTQQTEGVKFRKQMFLVQNLDIWSTNFFVWCVVWFSCRCMCEVAKNNCKWWRRQIQEDMWAMERNAVSAKHHSRHKKRGVDLGSDFHQLLSVDPKSRFLDPTLTWLFSWPLSPVAENWIIFQFLSLFLKAHKVSSDFVLQRAPAFSKSNSFWQVGKVLWKNSVWTSPCAPPSFALRIVKVPLPQGKRISCIYHQTWRLYFAAQEKRFCCDLLRRQNGHFESSEYFDRCGRQNRHFESRKPVFFSFFLIRGKLKERIHFFAFENSNFLSTFYYCWIRCSGWQLKPRAGFSLSLFSGDTWQSSLFACWSEMTMRNHEDMLAIKKSFSSSSREPKPTIGVTLLQVQITICDIRDQIPFSSISPAVVFSFHSRHPHCAFQCDLQCFFMARNKHMKSSPKTGRQAWE